MLARVFVRNSSSCPSEDGNQEDRRWQQGQQQKWQGPDNPSWTPCGLSGRVAPSPFITPPSCEGPQRKARGLGWPPGSWPNPLLMSGQPEGLSPWPQPCNPGAPAKLSWGQGSPKAFARTFLFPQHIHLTHIPIQRPQSWPGQPRAPASAGTY